MQYRVIEPLSAVSLLKFHDEFSELPPTVNEAHVSELKPGTLLVRN
jgi:hypothetical protein